MNKNDSMEEILKHSLHRNGTLEPGEALELFDPVFHALIKFHEANLIHCEICPEMIVVCDGNAKLLVDYGTVADFSHENKQLIPVLNSGYAPIEQYAAYGTTVGPWIDVYAISAVMYQCICVIKPVDSLDRLVEDRLLTPTELGVPVPVKFEKALMKGLALNRKKRYQSIEKLLTGLKKAERQVWWKKYFTTKFVSNHRCLKYR